MGKHSLAVLEAAAGPITFHDSVVNMGHSAILGAVLMFITVWATYQTIVPGPAKRVDEDGDEEIDSPSELILSSANVMFMCFGMSSIMLLVSNNLARAFTIGATIALIRFKIKMNSKAINMGLFYGALVGMSCGVDQAKIGYVAVAFFGFMQIAVVTLAKVSDHAKLRIDRRRAHLRVLRVNNNMTDPLPKTPFATQAPVDSSQDV